MKPDIGRHSRYISWPSSDQPLEMAHCSSPNLHRDCCSSTSRSGVGQDVAHIRLIRTDGAGSEWTPARKNLAAVIYFFYCPRSALTARPLTLAYLLM